MSQFYIGGFRIPISHWGFTARITTIGSPIFPNDFIRGILINHYLYFNTDFTHRNRKEPAPFDTGLYKFVLSLPKDPA